MSGIKIASGDLLNMMVVSMKYQDPLSATDENFVSDLMNISNVEQSTQSAQYLKQILDLEKSKNINLNDHLIPYIGKEVVADYSYVDLKGGAVKCLFNIPEDTSKVSYEIYDKKGDCFYTKELFNVKAGMHDFTWDGHDNSNRLMQDDRYDIRVKVQSGGVETEIDNVVKGIVSSLESHDGQSFLKVGHHYVEPSQIIQVSI